MRLLARLLVYPDHRQFYVCSNEEGFFTLDVPGKVPYPLIQRNPAGEAEAVAFGTKQDCRLLLEIFIASAAPPALQAVQTAELAVKNDCIQLATTIDDIGELPVPSGNYHLYFSHEQDPSQPDLDSGRQLGRLYFIPQP